MTDIKDIIPAEVVQAAISQQVIASLTPDVRDKLLADAVAALLKVDMTKAFDEIRSYGPDDEKYEIETARKFHHVVTSAIRGIVVEQLKTDVYKDKLGEISTTILDKLMPVIQKNLDERLDSAVGEMVENMLTPKSRY